MSETEKKKCRIVRKYEGGHTDGVICVKATQDHVFTGSDDSTVVMYERKGEGKQIGTFKGHRWGVSSMCITKDRKGLITGHGTKRSFIGRFRIKKKYERSEDTPTGCFLSIRTEICS